MSDVNPPSGAVPRNDARGGPASRVDGVYQEILLKIVRGELSGGTELKSTQLARELGVSRTPVVQALHRLAADGLVRLEMNKRAVVRPGAENWLLEIHEIRELLEPQAAALAAGKVPNEELDALERLAEEARHGTPAERIEAMQKFDFALHLAIADHAGNFALSQAIRKCWGFKRLSYLAIPEPVETVEKGFQEHLSILAALRKGEADTARAAMTFHLRSAATSRPSEKIV